MVWKELTKIALLGTEHSHLSEGTKKKLEEHGINLHSEESTSLLEAAAFYAQINKAAFPLMSFSGKYEPSPDDSNHAICSAKSTHHLHLILDEGFEDALPEFIFYLNHFKRQLPPKYLPQLLNRCLQSEETWNKLKGAIGSRGKWLINQNPLWKALDYFPNPDDWLSEDLEQRLKFLIFYRQESPEKALEILTSSWDKEAYKSKVAFLKILRLNLSKKDEDFLDECLYDSRKEVRSVAAGLLASTPESELVERMFLRASDLVELEGDEIKISFIEELDETIIRDGIEIPKGQTGEKSKTIIQILSRLPMERWEQLFDKEIESIVDLIFKSQWLKLLCTAMMNACLRFQEKVCAGYLIKKWLEIGNNQIWNEVPVEQLVDLIDDKTFNEITTNYLSNSKQLLSEKSPVSKVLLSSNNKWSDPLTMMVIGRFRNWLSTTTAYHWDKWHYKALLKKAAYSCPPSTFEKLKSGWNKQAPIWGMWEPEVEQFLRILIFRKEMTSELKKD